LRVEAAAHCAPAAAAGAPDVAPSAEEVAGVGSDGSVGPGTFKGVTVRYEFRTVKNDVALEIRTRPLPPVSGANGSAASAAASAAAPAAAAPGAGSKVGDGEWTVLKPSKRYQSDSEPVCSSFVLSGPAEVLFVFDNSFSYFTGKSLLYRVEVDAAVEHPADPDEGQLASQLDAVVFSPEADAQQSQ